MRPLTTTHRSTRAACGGDRGAGAGDPLLPFARPRARRRGGLRGRGDAAGLLGRHREPARGEASASRVDAGAGDGLALHRQRRSAHVRQPRREHARVRVRRQPVRAAAPAHARRRRVAVHGQRGRDRLHGRRARGGRGASRRPVRPLGRRLVLRHAARRRPRSARLRRSIARLSRRPRAPMALPHIARRSHAARVRTRRRGPHAGGSLRSRAPVRRRQPLRRGLVRPRTAGAWLLAADRLSRRPLPLRELHRGRRMRPMLMGRAGALAGAGALAAASLACRRHEPARQDCLRLEAPPAPVGFDATFSMKATLDCPELAGGRVAWRQVEGPALRDLTPARGGFELTARLPPIADVVGGPGSLGRGPAVAADARRGRAAGDLDRRPGPHAGARGARRRRPPRARPAQHAGRRPRPPRRRGLARHRAPGGQHRRARHGRRRREPAARRRGRLAAGGRRAGVRSPCAAAATTKRRSTAGAPAAMPRSPTPSRPAR